MNWYNADQRKHSSKRRSMMIFRQLLNESVAAASYLIGCAATGEAAVVDPSLPAEHYALLAADKGLRITTIFETHLHADYISTGRALAALTGATVRVPRTAEVAYEHQPLDDGDRLMVGNVAVTALHTPGHTPEHTAYLVSDTPRAERPWFVLTGDCLFVGDVGRADLVDLPHTGAEPQFYSLFERLLSLPDDVEIYPGHFGGSACGGKAMSGKVSSTIGFERRYNKALQARDLPSFAEYLNATPRGVVENVLLHRHTNQGHLPLPANYFAPQQRTSEACTPSNELQLDAAVGFVGRGVAVLDLRTRDLFAAQHVRGALNTVYSRDGLRERVAAAVAPGEALLVLGENQAVARAAADDLVAARRNPVAGYLAASGEAWAAAGGELDTIKAISIHDLHKQVLAEEHILDVRDPTEWEHGTIPGALLISLNELRDHLGNLPRSQALVVVCESGLRASLGASILRRHGFRQVAFVSPGGMTEYAAAYPLVREA
jgi:hydroxyacylglutathione hydrolase